MTTLNSVIVTANDLEQAKRYYTKGLKLVVCDEVRLDPSVTKTLWALPEEHQGEALVLKRRCEDEYGYIRLVHLEGSGGRDIRGQARRWDWGIFDLAFIVTDNQAKVDAIESLGYRVHLKPLVYHYNAASGAEFDVVQSIVAGPNSVLISFIERFGAPISWGHIDPATGFSELGDSAQIVEDSGRSIHFYSELLEVPLDGPSYKNVSGKVNEVMGIPADATVTITVLGENSLRCGHTELLEVSGLDSQFIPAQRSILNYGLAALSFAVADLDSTYRRLIAGGVEMLCPPIESVVPGVGRTRALTCFAPGGVPCEVYQRT